jgi:hypothetical protein
MATISKNKGNNKIKMMVTEQELNTLTIAMALLSVPEMETEMEEQGLTQNQVAYNHLELFDTLTKINKLYPQVTGEEVSE